MNIVEIDDKSFKEKLYRAVTKTTDDRRFRNHSTDLIYCPRKAFARKVLLTEDYFTDESYETILSWMWGKGIQIGITTTLNLEGEIEVLYNPDDKESVGNIDFEFENILYELKTSLYSHKSRRLPWITAIVQAMQYCAAKNKRQIKIKMWYVERFLDKFDKRWKVRPKERTWLLELSDEDIPLVMQGMREKDTMLSQALASGNWQSLPQSDFEWECNNCLVCAMLETYEQEGLLRKVHQEYLQKKSEYHVKELSGHTERDTTKTR